MLGGNEPRARYLADGRQQPRVADASSTHDVRQ
jgi:hypothetical protein